MSPNQHSCWPQSVPSLPEVPSIPWLLVGTGECTTAGCTIGVVSQIASLCKVGQRLINLTDFCIISFHGVFQSKRAGLRTRIMRNLKLHFRKPQSQDEIKPNQPSCAVVPGQSHSSFWHVSCAGLQSSAAPASVWVLLQRHWHQAREAFLFIPPFR